MKKILWVIITLLLVCSFCLAEVNQGIQTRVKGASGSHFCTLDSAQTDTSEIIVNLWDISEQGWTVIGVECDTTDTFNVWFSSGMYMKGDTMWSERVQCVWAEILTAGKAFGPISVSWLQSLALVDSSDARTGYMPAHYFRISVEPSGAGLDAVTNNNRFYVKELYK